ncbi:hypothetical protein [Ensifer sesbaniae]|nr:hypothetical protein [Ensifer sesbaniae]NRQ16478.1 hypothetical protein [Ensifer sesbaniae]
MGYLKDKTGVMTDGLWLVTVVEALTIVLIADFVSKVSRQTQQPA